MELMLKRKLCQCGSGNVDGIINGDEMFSAFSFWSVKLTLIPMGALHLINEMMQSTLRWLRAPAQTKVCYD